MSIMVPLKKYYFYSYEYVDPWKKPYQGNGVVCIAGEFPLGRMTGYETEKQKCICIITGWTEITAYQYCEYSAWLTKYHEKEAIKNKKHLQLVPGGPDENPTNRI